MGANAVACAAATATLQVIKEEGLGEKAQVRGDQLRSLLHQLRERYPQIADIRGPGLMVAAEFYTQADDMRPFPNHDPRYSVKKGFAGAVTKKCVENGMLLLNTGRTRHECRAVPCRTVQHELLTLLCASPCIRHSRDRALHSGAEREHGGTRAGLRHF